MHFASELQYECRLKNDFIPFFHHFIPGPIRNSLRVCLFPNILYFTTTFCQCFLRLLLCHIQIVNISGMMLLMMDFHNLARNHLHFVPHINFYPLFPSSSRKIYRFQGIVFWKFGNLMRIHRAVFIHHKVDPEGNVWNVWN